MPTRIWYQSFVDDANAGPYWDLLRRHLDAVADEDTTIEVHGITPYDSYAHPLVEWRCAREMICNAIRAEREGYDAFVIGHFQDAGLYEARAAVGIPVFGLGETSMLYGCMIGQRLGLVTFKPAYLPWFRQQIARYGLTQRVGALHPAPVEASLYADAHRSREAAQPFFRWFEGEVRPLIKSGCDVIVPTGGGPMTLLSKLGQVDGAPVLDGVAVTTKMAEAAVNLRRTTGLQTSRAGGFALPPTSVIEEFLAHPKGL